MRILEVKNNLVKILYEATDSLRLSGFVILKDEIHQFIAQVIYFEASKGINVAILKLLFNFDEEGVVTDYNGTVPTLDSKLTTVETEDLLELLPVKTPLEIGKLAQQNCTLNLNKTLLENNLLIVSDSLDNSALTVKNLALQLSLLGKRSVIFDTNGDIDFCQNKLVYTKDFKLPLNWDTINFIYEKGLDDATAETKALIQEIFLQVQEYVKTLPEAFIPFDTFKNVVDEQYKISQIAELVLLKNKLLKYFEQGIFAQSKSEFSNVLRQILENKITVIDISAAEDSIQREVIAFVYGVLKEVEDIFVFAQITNGNSDKKLLREIYLQKNVKTTAIVHYNYKYLTELKQIAKDLILFTPIKLQEDFATYSVFLNKLNADEFIVWGKSTHNMALIVQLEEIIPNETAEITIEKEAAPLLEPMADEAAESKSEPVSAEMGESGEEYSQLSDLTEDDLELVDRINEIKDETPTTEGNEPTSDEEVVEIDLGDEEYEKLQTPKEPESVRIELQPSEAARGIFEASRGSESEAEEITPAVEIISAKEQTPAVPIYPAEIPTADIAASDAILQGDNVIHPKYGRGKVDKMIRYGNKTLASVSFENVGRKLLDPDISELKKE